MDVLSGSCGWKADGRPGLHRSFNAAMTAVQVSALIEDEALVEIEATAVIPA
jgi:enamine deaminase RidA (YjgF/YER057c/UK114 family)